jgi:hypothetical protein
MEKIWIRDGKNTDQGYGINILDPQHWFSTTIDSAALKGLTLVILSNLAILLDILEDIV